MDLLSKLQDDMKLAMKAHDKDRLSVIRMLISDVKIIDLAPKPITAEETVAAYAKKLRKSVEEYEKLGHKAEADKLRSELAIVEEYLPKKASAEQTEAWLDAFLQGNNFNQKQFGQAMGMFLKQHGADVEPSIVSRLLKTKLPPG